MDCLLVDGFIDTFRECEKGPEHYSWWDQQSRARERNVGWRIDYFFISKNMRPRLKKAYIQPKTMGSDHCPDGIVLDKPLNGLPPGGPLTPRPLPGSRLSSRHETAV